MSDQGLRDLSQRVGVPAYALPRRKRALEGVPDAVPLQAEQVAEANSSGSSELAKFMTKTSENAAKLSSKNLLPHVPPGGGASGLTLGYGYDIGQQKKQDVIADLATAGISDPTTLAGLAAFAQKAGPGGKTWITDGARSEFARRQALPKEEGGLKDFSLTQEQADRLFDLMYARKKSSTARALAIGGADKGPAADAVAQVAIDMNYRGDLQSTTTKAQVSTAISGESSSFIEAFIAGEVAPLAIANVPDRQYQRLRFLVEFAAPDDKKADFLRRMSGELAQNWTRAVEQLGERKVSAAGDRERP